MAIEHSNGCTVITGEDISLYQMIVQCSALKLEAKGMKRHGRSMLSIVKRQYGLKGNRDNIIAQMEWLLCQERIKRGYISYSGNNARVWSAGGAGLSL